MTPAVSRLPALLTAESRGRVEPLARTAAEKRYWVVINTRQGGLRGWIAEAAHYVIGEPLESWVDGAVTAAWLAAWGRGEGSFPADHVFVEISSPDGWLAISAVETADVLRQRCLHWAVALGRDGDWLAVPPLGCVLHDGTAALDPLLGEERIVAILRTALDVLASLSTRLATGGVALEAREKPVKMPKTLIQTRPGELLVNEWVSVMLK